MNQIKLINQAYQQAKQNFHRQLIVLSGEESWGIEEIKSYIKILSLAQGLWINDPSYAFSILGQEINTLIFNAFKGFHPDAFAAIIGTVKGGNIIFLLIPPLKDWPYYQDPDYIRFCSHNYTISKSIFLKRIVNIIENDKYLLLIEQKPKNLCLFTYSATLNAFHHPIYKTEDQKKTVDAIVKIITSYHKQPLIITSHRGRGKSASLGIAAALLLQQKPYKIIVSAPRKNNIIFKHASQLIDIQEQLIFIPPDILLQEKPKCDLLLVDEAASIPTPLLESMLHHYAPIVFASTIHGYEGTGRGFAIRFYALLSDYDFSTITLNQPIRWAEQDPVENFSFKALLLNAKTADDAIIQNLDIKQAEFIQVYPEQLTEIELQQLFALLVLAHYQTKPSDLRYLLDAPNIAIYVLKIKQYIVGAVLITQEGGLDQTIIEAVYHGKRRPKGHLIPQSLTFHSGYPAAASLHYARIMRITIHPLLQGKKLGSYCIHKIIEKYKNIDYIGVSFGATEDLLYFWDKLGFLSVKLGTSKDASSNTYSVIMLYPVSLSAQTLLSTMHQRFIQQFPYTLSELYSQLETSLILFFLQKSNNIYIDQQDKQDAYQFSNGFRPYENTIIVLFKYSLLAIKNKNIDPIDKKLVILKILQQKSWQEVAQLLSLTGKKAIVKKLRAIIKKILSIK